MNESLYLQNKKMYIVALFSAAAITIYFLEMLIPKPVPFLKLGLANVFVLLFLANKLYKEGFLILFSKSIIGGILTGTLVSPTTVLSLGGGLLSYVVMLFVLQTGIPFSIVGISIFGAVSHNIAQIFLVYLLLIQNTSIFYLLPILLLLGVATGLLSGYLAFLLERKLKPLLQEL